MISASRFLWLECRDIIYASSAPFNENVQSTSSNNDIIAVVMLVALYLNYFFYQHLDLYEKFYLYPYSCW